MTRSRTASMTIYREVGFGDDETEEQPIEVDITGELCRAEPDIGIMSRYCEDVEATHVIDGKRVAIELTKDEEERAQELLCDADS